MHVDPFTPLFLFVRECYRTFDKRVQSLKIDGTRTLLITGIDYGQLFEVCVNTRKRQVVFDLLDVKF